MTPRAFDADAIARFHILADDRPFVTGCLLCMAPALELTLTRKGNFRLECGACRANGFIKSAVLLRGWVGAGETLREQSVERLAGVHALLTDRGLRCLGGSRWEVGDYGGRQRKVLDRGLLCVCCGSARAALRLDSRDKPYLACAGGCTSLLFLPDPGVVPVLAGWTSLRQERGLATWGAWVQRGQESWERWQGLTDGVEWTHNEAAATAKEGAWTGSTSSSQEGSSSETARGTPSPTVPIFSRR